MHTEIDAYKFVWKKRFIKSSSIRPIYHAMCVVSKSHDAILIVSWISFAHGSRYLEEKGLTIWVLQEVLKFGKCFGTGKILLWHLRKERCSSVKTKLLSFLLRMSMMTLYIWMEETEFLDF